MSGSFVMPLGSNFMLMNFSTKVSSGTPYCRPIEIAIENASITPLETFVEKFINMKFEPSGMTNDPDIRFASSLLDYVFRRLALDNLPTETREGLGIKSITERKEIAQLEAGTETAAPAEPEASVEATTAETVGTPAIELTERPGAKASDAPLCYSCGSKMQPAGSCYVCTSCGSTSGCS